jgi:hypothetical protein
MAKAIHVFIKPKGAADDAMLPVEHIFYGRTEAEADKVRLAHMAACEIFALAEAEDRTSEEIEDLADEDVPTWAGVGFDELEVGADGEDDGEGEDDDQEDEPN